MHSPAICLLWKHTARRIQRRWFDSIYKCFIDMIFKTMRIVKDCISLPRHCVAFERWNRHEGHERRSFFYFHSSFVRFQVHKFHLEQFNSNGSFILLEYMTLGNLQTAPVPVFDMRCYKKQLAFMVEAGRPMLTSQYTGQSHLKACRVAALGIYIASQQSWTFLSWTTLKHEQCFFCCLTWALCLFPELFNYTL